MTFIYYNITMNKKITDNRLKLARVESELTQSQLAERVGVTRQTIGLIEAGGYNPSLNLCIQLARATNKTLDQLFWTGEENDVIPPAE